MGGKKRVCVIGSGVVGLTTAVKLLEDCHTDVEVLDITDLREGIQKKMSLLVVYYY